VRDGFFEDFLHCLPFSASLLLFISIKISNISLYDFSGKLTPSWNLAENNSGSSKMALELRCVQQQPLGNLPRAPVGAKMVYRELSA
jgi:hypothetical protein